MLVYITANNAVTTITARDKEAQIFFVANAAKLSPAIADRNAFLPMILCRSSGIEGAH